MNAKIAIAASLGIALLVAARTGHGQSAAAEDGSAAATAADVGGTAPTAVEGPAKSSEAAGKAAKAPVGSLRGEMEQDLAEIGKIAQKAQRDGDMIKIACVTDKQDRAEGVMDVATPEIALLQAESADPTSQSFAGEKLQAAALRLGKLLDEARACTGAPAEAGDANGQNVVDEGDRLPPEDPTASPPGGPGSLPPDDPSRPPIASPVR